MLAPGRDEWTWRRDAVTAGGGTYYYFFDGGTPIQVTPPSGGATNLETTPGGGILSMAIGSAAASIPLYDRMGSVIGAVSTASGSVGQWQWNNTGACPEAAEGIRTAILPRPPFLAACR